MSGAIQGSGYTTKSAFQAFYLVIFVFAVIGLVSGLGHGANPGEDALSALLHVTAGSPMAHQTQAARHTNTLFFWIFFATFAVHLLRIYVTLEMMEEEFGNFTKFYSTYGKFWRFLDFVSRLAIIAILTLKVIPIPGFKDFVTFVFYFYVALTIWGAIAMLGGKKTFKDAFLLSSLCGLVTSIFLKFFTMDWLAMIIICALATGFLLVDLLVPKMGNSIWRFIFPFCRKWLTNY